ncbi:MAG: hypothetical protein LBO21_00565 [Synergistaceae bacterium]|jgi:hypothetical protein|nr:hypothetical protein [Synergistaceae bacterium]
MSNETKAANNAEDRIEWFGIDGLLCAIYVIEAFFIGYCIIHNVDIVVGRIVPYAVSLVTALVFLKYLREVFSFSRSKEKR